MNPFYYVSTKASNVYSQFSYPDTCFFVFGKETKGLPESLLANNYESCIRIPMIADIRSLNLSNSVAIVAYEFLRQNNFMNLERFGHLS